MWPISDYIFKNEDSADMICKGVYLTWNLSKIYQEIRTQRLTTILKAPYKFHSYIGFLTYR